MSFTEPRYLLLLAAAVLLYYGLPHRYRIWMLILVSYAFYAAWKLEYAGLMLIVSLLCYASALGIERSRSPLARKGWFGLCLAGCLGLLFYFKYTGFALRNLLRFLEFIGLPAPGEVTLTIILPVGISFFTFQALSYVIDVYRKRFPARRNVSLVICYVAFFPQLVAGPIERASHLIPQLEKEQSFQWENIRLGIQLIFWGFIKKCVFGDRFREFGLDIVWNPQIYTPPALLAGMMAASAWIYLDFSSYTDIARGSARLMGIDLVENFRQPYLATNLADLWSRWHMSLTSWVMDYVFRPLLRWLPRRTACACLATIIAMFLVGAWHGAQGTFMVWGTVHGILLASRHVIHRYYRPSPPGPGLSGMLTFARRIFITQLIWVLTGVLFASPTLKRAMEVYWHLFNWYDPLHQYLYSLLFALTWGTAALVFYAFHALKAKYQFGQLINQWHPALRATFYMACYYLLYFGSMAASTDYWYFQF